MGEQLHILGAERGPWICPHRLSDTVVTPELQITQLQPPMIQADFDAVHNPVSSSQHSVSALHSIKVIALRDVLRWVHIYSRAFVRILLCFWKICPFFHIYAVLRTGWMIKQFHSESTLVWNVRNNSSLQLLSVLEHFLPLRQIGLVLLLNKCNHTIFIPHRLMPYYF